MMEVLILILTGCLLSYPGIFLLILLLHVKIFGEQVLSLCELNTEIVHFPFFKAIYLTTLDDTLILK